MQSTGDGEPCVLLPGYNDSHVDMNMRILVG
jgi:hypothetical protein